MEDNIRQIPPLLLDPVSQCARPGPSTRLPGPHVYLAPAVESMADQPPVDEVSGVVDGRAGTEFKGRCRQKALGQGCRCGGHDTDCRVRVEAPDDWVGEGGHVHDGCQLLSIRLSDGPKTVGRSTWAW
jgi:hypothetical protein